MEFFVLYSGFYGFLSTMWRVFARKIIFASIMGIWPAGGRVIKNGKFADKGWI
jgi:hypothetical protein